MFMEITQFPSKPDVRREFEAVIAKTMPGFKSSKVIKAMSSAVSSKRRRTIISWCAGEKLEDHTVTYAQSDFRNEVGAAFGPFADGRPVVEHGRLVAS